MSRFKYLLYLILIIGWVVRCPASVELDRIAAVVNDDVVMRSELDERIRAVTSQLNEQGTTLPPQGVLQRQVLDRLILTKLQIQEAQHTGIRVDDETLNRTINNIAARNKVSLAEFRKILESDNYSYEKFREDIRNEILISRLVQRQVNNRVNVSESEIENFLATMEQQGVIDKEYKISHILITIPQNASPETIEKTREKAAMILKELKNGKDFAQMAATYSDGQQALDGGDLGWRKAGQVPTLFADFIAIMRVGDISDIITSPSGYHIIRLDDERTGKKVIITQTRARHILIRPNEVEDEKDVVRRLKQLKIRIENGDDFGELARAHSQDTVSAAQGGDLGWVSPGDLVPEFEQAMKALKDGEVSQPFETQYGWHIVQVLEHRKHDNTKDAIRNQAREAIRERKLAEAKDNWLRQMRDDAYVEYRLKF